MSDSGRVGIPGRIVAGSPLTDTKGGARPGSPPARNVQEQLLAQPFETQALSVASADTSAAPSSPLVAVSCHADTSLVRGSREGDAVAQRVVDAADVELEMVERPVAAVGTVTAAAAAAAAVSPRRQDTRPVCNPLPRGHQRQPTMTPSAAQMTEQQQQQQQRELEEFEEQRDPIDEALRQRRFSGILLNRPPSAACGSEDVAGAAPTGDEEGSEIPNFSLASPSSQSVLHVPRTFSVALGASIGADASPLSEENVAKLEDTSVRQRHRHPARIRMDTSRPLFGAASSSSSSRSVSPVSTASSQSSCYVHKIVVREDPRLNRFDVQQLDVHEGDVVLFEWVNVHNVVQVAGPDSREPISTPASNGRPRRYRRSGSPTAFGKFTCPFADAGDYYFCSERNPDSRVHIRVLPRPSPQSVRFLFSRIVAFTVLAAVLLGTAAFVAVSWVQQHAYFINFGGDDIFLQPIADAFRAHAFPWYIFGLIIIVAAAIAAMLNQLRYSKLSSFGRGFAPEMHSLAALVALLLFCTLMAVTIALWHYTIGVSDAFGLVATRLSTSIIVAVNDVMSTVFELRFLRDTLPDLLPDYEPPSGTESSESMIELASEIASTVKFYSSVGENIFRAAVRILNVIQFLSLQLVLTSCAIGLIGSLQRKASLVRGAVWVAVFATACIALSIGTTGFLREVMRDAHRKGAVIESREFSIDDFLQISTLDRDSVIIKALSLCTEDRHKVGFGYFQDALEQGIDALNEQLRDAEELGELRNFTGPGIARLTVSQLANFSAHLQTQLDLIDEMIREDNQTLTDRGINATALPALRAVVAVHKSLLRIIDCAMLRQVLASALPVIRYEVIRSMDVQLRLKYTTFALLLLATVCSSAAAVVFARPHKLYVHEPTSRWFLFPHSLRVHQRVVQRMRKALGKLPKSQKYWTYPCCTMHRVVAAFSDTNAVASMLIMLQAILLVVLHLSSSGENRLEPLLIAGTICCFFAPLMTIPVGFSSSQRVQFAVRFAGICVAGATVSIGAIFVAFAISDALWCIDHVGERRSAVNMSLVTAEEVHGDDCAPNVISRKLEASVYTVFVTFFAAVAFMAGLVLLPCHRHVMYARYVIPGVSAARRTYRRIARFLISPRGIRLFAACMGFIIIAGGLAILLPVWLSGDDSDRNTCNGSPANCGRRLNEVAWGTTHNSFSSSADRFVGANHFFGMNYQLYSGARALMLDVWNHRGAPHLCHRFCEIGRISLDSGLETVFRFLLDNPREVLVIFFEQYVLTSEIVRVFEAQSDKFGTDVISLIWEPPVAGMTAEHNDTFVWPTLRDLIAANRRLVVFTDEPPEPSRARNVDPPSWFLFQFDFMYETTFMVRTIGELESCSIGRGFSNSTGAMRRKAAVIKHFVTVGGAVPSLAVEANDRAFIVRRAEACIAEWNSPSGWQHDGGRFSTPNIARVGNSSAQEGSEGEEGTEGAALVFPSFFSVDFWSLGHPAGAVADINRIIGRLLSGQG